MPEEKKKKKPVNQKLKHSFGELQAEDGFE